MWCNDVCDVADLSNNFNDAHDNDSDDDNDDILVSEKHLSLGRWSSSSFTLSPGLPGPFLIHKCFHGNRDLGSLIESLDHLGNRAKGGAWLIDFFVLGTHECSQKTHVRSCTCDQGTFMIKEKHTSPAHRQAAEENYLRGAWTLQCGSFIIVKEETDWLFAKYSQTQSKSGKICTVCIETCVINKKNNTIFSQTPF